MSFYNDVATAAKLANVMEVFKAASLLHQLGLQTESPADTLKRYIAANPDINDFVSRHPDGRAE
jgi:hypothetical protein